MQRTIDLIERRRIDLQAELDAKKTQAERNRLGQFATPTALAVDILKYASTLIPPNEKISFLDPAIGTGSFYSALLKTFNEKRIDKAFGFEIDPYYAEPAMQLWKDTNLTLKLDPARQERTLG